MKNLTFSRSHVLTFVVLFGACSSTNPPAGPRTEQDSAKWVNSTLASLTLEQKVGQMLMGRLEGDFENVHEAGLQRAIEVMQKYDIGGYAVGIGSPAEFAIKTNALQRASRLPLLFAADLEWGSGMRLWRPTYLPYGMEGGGGTAFPFNMGIGATNDPALADTAGRITGEEARAVGINWVFAPVLDVNTDPANPIVNVRSYGSNSADVARFGAAFIRGAARARVLTAIKHFPGHGDTNIDSHVDLPLLNVGSMRLDTLELVPFKAGMEAGASAVMLGHLAIPAVIGDSITPASISARIGEDIVRKQMHFDGIIVTDAMTMGALRKVPGYTPGEVAVRAVEAGSDIVLSPPDLEQAHQAIVAAVKSGRITQARIDASVRRIIGAKAWLGLNRERFVSVERVNDIVASPAHEAAAALLAEKSITLVRDAGNVLPLDPRKVHKIALIAFGGTNDISAGRTLSAQLQSLYGDQVTYTRLDENASAGAFDNAVRRASEADAVVFATFLMPISGQGYLRVPPRAEELANRLSPLNKPTVVVSFGDPYGPSQLALATTYMAAWQPRGLHAQIAVARAIAGVTPITGMLPIDLKVERRGSGVRRDALNTTIALARPGEVGMRDDINARVDSIIIAALANRAAPGASVAIGRHGKLIKLQGYGNMDYRPGFSNVTDSTLYDLASLTKVIGTTTATMLLYDEGKIDLDAPISRYLPEFLSHPDKTGITVRNLMLHNAGYKAFGPLYRNGHTRAEYLKQILDLPLEYPTGTKSIYSDFSMITLGLAIERLTGQTLDEFLKARVYRPMGMRDTGFNPDSSLFWRVAPTENDTVYRKEFVHGHVHDENAYGMGGVSGHAGLFSSARDLAKFAQMLLNGGYYNGRRYIEPNTIKYFTRRAGENSRAIGWDTPSPNSSAGDYFSPNSFGHTGFTGTSIWVDPDKDLFVVLLTNRVNPTRDNQKQGPLRRALADAVQTAVVDMPVVKREWK